MGILDLFRRSAPPVEQRSSGSGYTAMVMQARGDFIRGRTGLAELSGTVSSCVSLWSAGLALATVKGTDLLNPSTLTMVGRSLALRGEWVGLLDADQIVPASDWECSTRSSRPVAYRLSIPDAGGGRTMTALAGEVVHFRINSDPSSPWAGVSPLRTASLSAGLLHSVESALSEAYESMPFGSQVVPFPEAPETDMTSLGSSFRGQRGRVLVRESVQVTAAGGPAPAQDFKPSDLTPSLERAVPMQALAAARASILAAYGVLPAMFDPATTGQTITAANRQLAQWTLQPLANLIAEECSDKLGGSVALDVLTGTQSFDTGAAARSLQMIVTAMAVAKEQNVDLPTALKMLDWSQER